MLVFLPARNCMEHKNIRLLACTVHAIMPHLTMVRHNQGTASAANDCEYVSNWISAYPTRHTTNRCIGTDLSKTMVVVCLPTSNVLWLVLVT